MKMLRNVEFIIKLLIVAGIIAMLYQIYQIIIYY
jgi:hypothetical protein